MSANVETMMYVRETPWHGLGTRVEEAPNSAEALKLAGLDWEVEQTDVYTDGGIIIPGYKANKRSTDGSVLGIVSNRYRVVQNKEAFEFTDAIVGETEDGVVKYETAGSLNHGKRIWLLAKMPRVNIVGDDVDPYIVFTNAHDGSGAIKVAMSNLRVVCSNTLALSLSTAKRQWSAKHVGDMASKIEEAKMCLGLANKYIKEFDIQADKWANAKLYKEQVDEILDEMFPIDDEASDRKKNNIKQVKDEFYIAYFMPDIKQFRETAYGAINAMSDFVTHSAPKRNTASYNEKRWEKIIDGHPMLERFVSLVNQKISV